MTGAAGSSGSYAPFDEKKTAAAISLLSDESEVVVQRCRAALVAMGEAVRPRLLDELSRVRGDANRLLRHIVAEIDGPRLEREVIEMLGGRPDLEQGSILLGRLVDGGAGPDGVAGVLDAMAERADDLLHGQREPDRVLDVLRKVLVCQEGLRGVPYEHVHLVDALLHGATSHRRAMPLPLCIVWVLVGRRLGVPIVGLGMPGHMLVRYDRPDGLLVLDPFHGGQTSDEDFWRRFLVAQGFVASDLTALDATDGEMLVRTLRNLLNLAPRDGEPVLAERCHRILRAAAERVG